MPIQEAASIIQVHSVVQGWIKNNRTKVNRLYIDAYEEVINVEKVVLQEIEFDKRKFNRILEENNIEAGSLPLTEQGLIPQIEIVREILSDDSVLYGYSFEPWRIDHIINHAHFIYIKKIASAAKVSQHIRVLEAIERLRNVIEGNQSVHPDALLEANAAVDPNSSNSLSQSQKEFMSKFWSLDIHRPLRQVIADSEVDISDKELLELARRDGYFRLEIRQRIVYIVPVDTISD